jgi:hypothetical protein
MIRLSIRQLYEVTMQTSESGKCHFANNVSMKHQRNLSDRVNEGSTKSFTDCSYTFFKDENLHSQEKHKAM